VGLSEIIFNQDWPYLILEDICITACKNSAVGGKWIACKQHTITEAEAKKGYVSVEEFITTTLKRLIETALKGAGATKLAVVCKVDATTKRFSFETPTTTAGKVPLRLQFSSILLQILGVTGDQLVENVYFQTDKTLSFKFAGSHFPPNLRRNITSLWVYTDIIQPNMTGGMYTRLLRFIEVDGDTTNDISRVKRFDKPHYYPLSTGTVNNVTISIYNIGGMAPIQFASPVVCKLHFRRRAA
jgi:hypothetical protein